MVRVHLPLVGLPDLQHSGVGQLGTLCRAKTRRRSTNWRFVGADFCVDGVSFSPTEDTYLNGKVGIRFATANTSCRVTGVGFVYLEHAVINSGADTFDVTDNFVTECGSCVELAGSGQASKVTDNLIGAGYIGYSIFAEGHEGLLIAGNNMYPAGASLFHFKNVNRSLVTANKLKAYFPGRIDMEGINKENLIFHNQSGGS